jgi:hypothetical protein
MRTLMYRGSGICNSNNNTNIMSLDLSIVPFYLDKNMTMDNVQKHNIRINVPLSQTFRSYCL